MLKGLALSGTARFAEAASALVGGVHVRSQLRSHQQVRLSSHAQHVSASFAPHPGTPQTMRSRGGEDLGAVVGSARMDVCAHKTTRFLMAITYEGEATSRSLMAAALSWRTLDMVQAPPLRGLVEGFVQDQVGGQGPGGDRRA